MAVISQGHDFLLLLLLIPQDFSVAIPTNAYRERRRVLGSARPCLWVSILAWLTPAPISTEFSECVVVGSKHLGKAWQVYFRWKIMAALHIQALVLCKSKSTITSEIMEVFSVWSWVTAVLMVPIKETEMICMLWTAQKQILEFWRAKMGILVNAFSLWVFWHSLSWFSSYALHHCLVCR